MNVLHLMFSVGDVSSVDFPSRAARLTILRSSPYMETSATSVCCSSRKWLIAALFLLAIELSRLRSQDRVNPYFSLPDESSGGKHSPNYRCKLGILEFNRLYGDKHPSFQPGHWLARELDFCIYSRCRRLRDRLRRLNGQHDGEGPP